MSRKQHTPLGIVKERIIKVYLRLLRNYVKREKTYVSNSWCDSQLKGMDSPMNPGLENEAREMFQLFDKDQNGVWSCHELGLAMRRIGLTPTQAYVQETFKRLDKDGNGTIEYDEYLDLISLELAKQNTNEERLNNTMQAFEMFDKNHDGFIDCDELTDAMRRLGEPLSEQECRDMMHEVDIDGDGKISYREFVKKWCEFD